MLRFEIGFGSVGVHAEKKALENIKLVGDCEQTIRGYTLNARVEVRDAVDRLVHATDHALAAEAATSARTSTIPAELDIHGRPGSRLVYRLFIP